MSSRTVPVRESDPSVFTPGVQAMKLLRLGIRLVVVASFGLLSQSLMGQSTQSVYIAADVVVDPGGNDANTGTRRLPVKTIGKAISLAGKNGIVLVNPGSYCEAMKLLDGQIISGYGATVDGQSKLPTLASGGTNVTLLGLKFINASSAALQGAIAAGSGWRLEDRGRQQQRSGHRCSWHRECTGERSRPASMQGHRERARGNQGRFRDQCAGAGLPEPGE
jgi:Protein of unknown function (DUF1565)